MRWPATQTTCAIQYSLKSRARSASKVPEVAIGRTLSFSRAARHPRGPRYSRHNCRHNSLQGNAMTRPQASRALSRFKVIDLTRVRSGPTCVRQLADWGADVVMVEM